jgi:hypothetical protein
MRYSPCKLQGIGPYSSGGYSMRLAKLTTRLPVATGAAPLWGSAGYRSRFIIIAQHSL